MSAPLSSKKIEQMFKAYCQVPTVEHVARTCKVSPTTARKFIRHGDKGRGIEAIDDRYREAIKQAQKLSEQGFAASYHERAQAIVPLVDRLEGLVRQAADAIDGSMEDKPPRLIDLAHAIRIAAEVRRALWEDGQVEKPDAERHRPLAQLLAAIQEEVGKLEPDQRRGLVTALRDYETTGVMPKEFMELLLGGAM